MAQKMKMGRLWRYKPPAALGFGVVLKLKPMVLYMMGHALKQSARGYTGERKDYLFDFDDFP
jgi:hypothetical protein